jgi:uncharacterized protein YdaU (DUF1376 family)
MHYYQFNIADYRKDTTHLSRLEHSIYRDLIDWYYLDEAPIPLNLTSICRRLRIDSTDVELALNDVLTDFFERTENGYVQKRIEQEIVEFNAQIANASKAGKASAEARRIKANERALNDRSTNHKPITNNHKPVNLKNNERAPRFDAQAHLVSIGVGASVAADWIQHRKGLKAAPSLTAIDGIASEAARAGISLADALAMCCQRGWRGFKAEWLAKEPPRNNGNRPTIHDERSYTSAVLTGKVPSTTTLDQFISGKPQPLAIEGEVFRVA